MDTDTKLANNRTNPTIIVDKWSFNSLPAE
jgi:hypothetical protein